LDDAQERFSIGELSERTGCPIETIRYYERIGIASAPPRTESGRRAYSDEHVQQLTFICRARELGFSLARIRTLLALAGQEAPPCSEARAVAAAHLEEVRHRLAEQERLAAQLQTLIDSSGETDGGDCPIIAWLSKASQKVGDNGS
jgi:MerR family transcriptional regulator, mercuric resistance operon regulatory protein